MKIQDITKQFKDAEIALAAIKSAEAVAQRLTSNKCDWDDPEDVAEHRREQNNIQRTNLLQTLVPTRICPICGDGPIFETHRWIIAKDRGAAICKSCFTLRVPTLGWDDSLPPLVVGVEIRYKINWDALEALRKRLRLTKKRFATLAGWSTPYQSQLEMGKYATVSEDTVAKIVNVFKKFFRSKQ